MDDTETYIKMCKKAEEIQDLWDRNHYDFFYNPDHKSICITGYYDEDGEYLRGKRAIWLPRQSQLQEMVGDYQECCNLLHDYFDCEDGDRLETLWDYTLTSMEQLWLAFVMKEKYHKVWNTEDWVKE